MTNLEQTILYTILTSKDGEELVAFLQQNRNLSHRLTIALCKAERNTIELALKGTPRQGNS